MAHDERIAQRAREEMQDLPGFTEKKMFGGVGFLLWGNMACGVNGDDFIVRVGKDGNDEALSQPHTRVFDMTGKPMPGWILVRPEGVNSQADLRRWIDRGVKFTLTLPPK
ncbi:MAG: RNA methyltransferase [Chloroflexi bacterium RBG_16_57_11]|nr:MAG: RNA methyltransferase [Chloroflexi bacterium RBG_16_57_11]